MTLPAGDPGKAPVIQWNIAWRGTKKISPATEPPSFSFTIECNGVSQEYTGRNIRRNAFSSQEDRFSFPFVSNSHIRVLCQKQDSLTEVYIDYFQISYFRRLTMERDRPLLFRAPSACGYLSEFCISQAGNDVAVWETGQVTQTRKMPLRRNGDEIRFTIPASDTLKEFIAFRPGHTLFPEFVELTQPQNLHAYTDRDYVIVTHPEFEKQAQELARWHEERDGYRTCVVTTEQVYNEFSSGVQDPSAIRLFMKHLYDKASSPTDRPKYLLLFGAVSYDYKNFLGTHSNFIPSMAPSATLLNKERAYLGEDNFAYLEKDEGFWNTTCRGDMDIAVGRLPVRTTQQADAMVEKIKIYGDRRPHRNPAGDRESNFGAWRNEIVFTGSEAFLEWIENPSFFSHAVEQHVPRMNIRKIYQGITDSLPEINLVRQKIANSFNNGSFFIGYLGHSAADAWGNDNLLTVDDILNWDFTYTYPILFTSSCSFAVIDDPFFISGAEHTVLHPHGGCIATIGGTSTLFVGQIEQIQTDFVLQLLNASPQNPVTLGDAWLYAKNRHIQRASYGFVLLGDPGLKAAVPSYIVRTDSINGFLPQSMDTLRGRANVQVIGSVTQADGTVLQDFNGFLQYKLFGPPETRQKVDGVDLNTLSAVEYQTRETVLAAGQVEVKNGIFRYSFTLPETLKNIQSTGKISYYTYSAAYGDAAGYTDSLALGGIDSTVVIDARPPLIWPEIVYRNTFSGQEIVQIPYLRAELYDRNGLDIAESDYSRGMGLYIDNAERLDVSGYFRFYPGTIREGVLEYPLFLPAGQHRLTLEAWNIFGLSTMAQTDFNSVDNENFVHAETRASVTAVPNPALPTGYTDFYFESGTGENFSSCMLEVFDIAGKRIARKRFDLAGTTSSANLSLRWNWAETGTAMRPGLHICRFVFLSPDRETSYSRFCKLVVL